MSVFETKVKLFQFLKRFFLFFFQKNAKNKHFLVWHAWATIEVRLTIKGGFQSGKYGITKERNISIFLKLLCFSVVILLS